MAKKKRGERSGRVSMALGSWRRGLRKETWEMLVLLSAAGCMFVCITVYSACLATLVCPCLDPLLSARPMPSPLCCHLTQEWQSRVLTPYYENMRSKAQPHMTDTSSLLDPCHFSSIWTATIGSMLPTRTLYCSSISSTECTLGGTASIQGPLQRKKLFMVSTAQCTC